MYTGLQLAELVLSETGIPMNCEQIWQYATEKGYSSESGLGGKTPWRTIQSQIYINIRDKPESVFIQVSTRPVRFGLKKRSYTSKIKMDEEKMKTFEERDLHPLLVAYVDSDPHFEGHTKTIHHECSTKSKKNSEKWMHPDLVSVHFPFEDLDDDTVELAMNTGMSGIVLYSFEMKIHVTGSNVREYFFQAVSNSSWANEGYLVALDYTEDALDQLARLSSSFGIGVIKLNIEDIHQSEILMPSRENDGIDLNIIDDLLRINKEFRAFIRSVNDSMKTGRIINSDFDVVKNDDELKEYIIKKKIE